MNMYFNSIIGQSFSYKYRTLSLRCASHFNYCDISGSLLEVNVFHCWFASITLSILWNRFPILPNKLEKTTVQHQWIDQALFKKTTLDAQTLVHYPTIRMLVWALRIHRYGRTCGSVWLGFPETTHGTCLIVTALTVKCTKLFSLPHYLI